uniref:Uncharacterized protein n=1 Tax=Panagrolaimus superbus TaxID=310955 RepID=A0A914Z4H3_9BILA
METIEKTDNEKIDDEKNESEHSSSDESLIKVEPFVTNSKTKSNSTKSINDNNDKNEINNDNPISAKLEPPPSEVSIEEVEKVFRDYMLFADSTSENARIIQAKYAVAHERYGTALMQLKKIITDKTTTSDYLSTEKAIIEVRDRLIKI